MELRHLRYFIAVAEEENITRAAAKLHVSQPPLSRQLRDLEDELGLSLFQRGPKSLRLTAEGRVFLGEARKILDTVNEAMRVASTLAGKETGEINVGYAPSLTVELLPMALRAFNTLCSSVQVRLHDLSTEEMLKGLMNESLDVALMIKPRPPSLNGIEFKILRRNAICLAVHATHPFAGMKTVTLSQVASERLVAYTKEDYPEYHQWLKQLFSKASREPCVGEEHDSATSLIAAVESGRGVALVQQGFEHLCGPRLCLCKLSPPPPPFVVGVAWKIGRKLGPAEHFIAAAQKVVENKLSKNK
jgi:LysR family transcriptional regulator, benzoate and cis,cis-muconate-responsive activator of ben and cat genes